MDKYNMRKFTNNKNFLSVLPNRLNLNMSKNKDKKEVLLSYLENIKLINNEVYDVKKDMINKISNIFKEYIENDKLTIDKYIKIRNLIISINGEHIINYKDIIIDLLTEENYEMIENVKKIERLYFSFVNKLSNKITKDIRDYDVIVSLLEDGLKEELIKLYEESFSDLKDNEITNKIFEINKNMLENLFLRIVFLDVRRYQIEKVSMDPHFRNGLYKTKVRQKRNWV